jgi:23S rRNA (guanine745-N1)-methyltransferase
MATLLCTVRGCGAPLARVHRTWVCPSGHSYDCARSGYVNLLQPHDRRSRVPGDPPDAVAARRRFVLAGHEEPIVRTILDTIAGTVPHPGFTALDVGCGEGSFVGRLACDLGAEVTGLDISVRAIDLAARTYPTATWVVANADRQLPFAGPFDLVTSLVSRRNAREMRRVVASDGLLVVALPAGDDLVELREILHGRRVERCRIERTAQELGSHFRLRRELRASTVASLDETAISDLLASTYRGARRAERERLGGAGPLRITLARDVLVFDPV